MILIFLYFAGATITASFILWLDKRKGKCFEELELMTIFWPFVWAGALLMALFDFADWIFGGGKNGKT